MRVALLEDGRIDAEVLMNCLTHAGHTVHLFTNGTDLTTELRHESFDILILDLNTPGMNGLQVLQWVKVQSHLQALPILFVTAEERESNVVEALTHGADDYLVKPIRCAEFLARIQVAVRRTSSCAQPTRNALHVEGWDFDPHSKRVHFQNTEILLSAKEFDLAYFLFSNLGRLLSRGHLLECVWGMSVSVPTRTVDTHISKVRTQCHLFPENGVRLVSVYGYGYRLELIQTKEEN